MHLGCIGGWIQPRLLAENDLLGNCEDTLIPYVPRWIPAFIDAIKLAKTSWWNRTDEDNKSFKETILYAAKSPESREFILDDPEAALVMIRALEEDG